MFLFTRTSPRIQCCRYTAILFSSTLAPGSSEDSISKLVLPSRHVSIKDTHNGALQNMLGIVYVAEDVLHCMVALKSINDGVDDCAHLDPQVLLFSMGSLEGRGGYSGR